MNTTASEKSGYRMLLRKRATEFDDAARQHWSTAIQQQVMRLQPYRLSRSVACYVALPGEAATELIIADCRRHGKSLWLPAATDQDYIFRPWTDAKLVPGPLGIPQPVAGAGRKTMSKPALILVPGLGFDRCCRRIGRGGGIYDRLLASTPGFRLGLAFAYQVVDALPESEHDMRMDMVITEREVITGTRNTQTFFNLDDNENNEMNGARDERHDDGDCLVDPQRVDPNRHNTGIHRAGKHTKGEGHIG